MSAPTLLVPLLSLRPATTSSVVYVRHVVPLLAKEWGEESVVALCDEFGRGQLEGFGGRVELRSVKDTRLARLLALRRHLPEAVRATGAAAMFVPDGQVIGARVDVPAVLVLHHHLNFSRPQGQPLARRLYWALWHDHDVRRSAARAKALIAPTTVFAEEIVRWVPQARGKLHVVHHGVGRAFRAPLPEEARPTGARPHVLAVTNAHGYKNLDGTLRIFARASETLPHELRCAGIDEAQLDAAAARAGIDEAARRRIRALGMVSETRLAELYRTASALLFPTLLESFGMPAAEAMASGCPVACSDLPALREVTAGAAVTASPRDEPGFADALRSLLTDDAHAAALRAAGLERAKLFTWQRNAEQVARVIRSVIA